jgi:hypothetical protein
MTLFAHSGTKIEIMLNVTHKERRNSKFRGIKEIN